LSVYLDTSLVIPFFLADPFAVRAKAYLSSRPTGVVASDFVAAEFADVVARRCRAKSMTEAEGRLAFANFDQWIAQYTANALIEPSDFRDAERFIRRLDLPLRAPDAIHLAIARRLGAELATFDQRMADSARALGIPVAAL
jgi:uncharacterized protein